jgi:hypothetical protein
VFLKELAGLGSYEAVEVELLDLLSVFVGQSVPAENLLVLKKLKFCGVAFRLQRHARNPMFVFVVVPSVLPEPS